MNPTYEVVPISGLQIHAENLVIQHKLQLIKIDWKVVMCIKSKPMHNSYRISVKFANGKMIVNGPFEESVAINSALEKCAFLAKASKVKKALTFSSSNVYTPKLTHLAELARRNLENERRSSPSSPGSLMTEVDNAFKAQRTQAHSEMAQDVQLLGLEIQYDRVMYCLQGRSYYEPLSWSLVQTVTIKGASPSVILVLQNGQRLLFHGSSYNQIIRTCEACHFLHDSNKMSRAFRITSDIVYVVKDIDQSDMMMLVIGDNEVLGLRVQANELVLRKPSTGKIVNKIQWTDVLYIKKKRYSEDLAMMSIKIVDGQKLKFLESYDVVERFLRVAESLTAGKKGGLTDRILHKATQMYKFEIKDTTTTTLTGLDQEKRNPEDKDKQEAN